MAEDAVSMKASKQQDSRALMLQAKSNKKRCKQKTKLPLVQKWMSTVSPLHVLLDSLEAYDQVLYFSLKGMIYLCTLSDLKSVLKVNGFQSHHMTKEYIEKNITILNGVLFQTRFSSLITGEIAITAVALEDSEVEEDLAALLWRDGVSCKGLVMSPPEVDCSSELALNGCPADDPAESATANSSSKTLQPADILPVLLEFSADNCYRPDMSMVEMQKSVPYFCQLGPSSPSMYIPDARHIWPPQEEIFINSEPECEPLTYPRSSVLCFEEQLYQALSPVSSFDYIGSASKKSSESEEQVAYPFSSISHTTTEMVEIPDARAKPTSEDVMEKFAPFTPDSPSSIIYSRPFSSGEVLRIPNQSHGILSLQAKDIPIFEPETEQLTEPSDLVSDLEEVSEVEEEHSSHCSTPPAGFEEEPAQPSSPLSKSDHTAIASQEHCAAVADSELVENFELIEKFAMEALQLNVLHNVLEGEDLSNLEVLHETTSERSWPVVANFVTDYIRLEEDQSSNSCEIQEVQHNSPLYAMPSPQQQAASARASYTNFVDLLAQVSAQHSGALKAAICTSEERYPMFNTEAKSCARRLFMEDEAKLSEGEDITSARSPRHRN